LKHFVLKNINHLGIEPSLNVAAEANKLGIKTRSDFFSENIAEEIILEHGKADAFLAANVMCHIPNIVSVVRGIKKLLKPTGIVMFEEPYLGDVITKTSYDQIYDEHIFIFSGHSVQYLFANEGLELIDVIPQKTHGGSMRYILAHKDAYPICNSVSQLLNKEESMGLDKISTFHKFKKDVEKSKNDLVQLLTNLSNQGKKIAGYAATSKSTTILNFCGIGPSLISYICDTTPIKQGKFSPGMHIPVVPYDYFVENPPDFTLLFAWNHMDEILAKEKAYASGGGKWITHVPEVRIL
jgi:methylation protein EvaC